MPQAYSFTGDPQVDAMILSALQQQFGQSFNRQRSRLQESLSSRGLLGGGLEAAGIENLLGEQSQLEGGASLAAAQAHVQRIREQREQEQAIQNQMRLASYQAQLQQPKKLSALQRALLGAGSGAALGTAISPGWGTAIGGLGGGLYGYFNE